MYSPSDPSYAFMYSDDMNCVTRDDLPTPTVPIINTFLGGDGAGCPEEHEVVEEAPPVTPEQVDATLVLLLDLCLYRSPLLITPPFAVRQNCLRVYQSSSQSLGTLGLLSLF